MTTTRRSFLLTSAALASGVIPGGESAAARRAPKAPPLRKDVATLTDKSPDIIALKDAIDKMKRGVDEAGKLLGMNDGRRWAAQSAIHGTIADGFTSCQHGNWFFLPWHRIYLHHFEEIVRELSGNEAFALPYWDWTRTRNLPDLFWGANNPLDNPARPGVQGSGRRPGMTAQTKIEDADYNRFFSQTVITRILNANDFETFGGGEVAKPGDFAFQGQLESTPHNRAHTWISGDMATGGSPYDPIFWLHHCNVDRLWVEWSLKHPKATPNGRAWLQTTFPDFYDRKGNRIAAADRVTVEKSLNTTNLGYEYDRRKTTVGATPGASQPFVFSSLKSQQPTTLSPEVAKVALAYAPVTTKNFTQDVNAIIDSPLDLAARRTVRLRIAGVKPPENPETSLDVYLNCQKLSPNTPISDASYVGSCTFFAHGRHGHNVNADATLTLALNLTADFLRLYGDRPIKEDEPLQVAIIARRPAEGGKSFVTTDIKTVSPSQVTIEVVGPKA